MTDSPSAELHTRELEAPEAVVDGSELLTRPVYSALVAELSADPEKLDEVRAIVRRGADDPEALRQEIGRVYGRHVTLLEMLSIVEILA
ncbi:MAG TPA: hypothetical protein VGQ83_31565 [Polyangia bacterium]